jgi:uncharacterized protein
MIMRGSEKIMNHENQDIPRRKELVSNLAGQEDISFSYLFGSSASGRQNERSDIDLAVYFAREVPLMDQGLIVSRLESIAGRDVDLVVLNGMSERNPQFAYDIVFGGELLFSKDDKALDRYRRKTLHCFFDTEPLRRMLDAELDRRLSEGAFAEFGNG